jgi:hypothetical protein
MQLLELRTCHHQALQEPLPCCLRERATAEGEAAQAVESCKALVAIAAVEPQLKAFAELQVETLQDCSRIMQR